MKTTKHLNVNDPTFQVEDEWIFFTNPPFAFMSGGGSAEAINKTARDDSGDEGGADVPRSGSGKTRIYCYLFIIIARTFLGKKQLLKVRYVSRQYCVKCDC